MRTVSIQVEGMHCAACGLLIDDVMLDIDGVESSITDTKSGRCRVDAADHVGDDELLAAVVEAGYSGVITAG
jgi:Cu+-exporting ATPase